MGDVVETPAAVKLDDNDDVPIVERDDITAEDWQTVEKGFHDIVAGADVHQLTAAVCTLYNSCAFSCRRPKK